MIYTLENHELKHAVEEMLFHLLPTETLSRADTAEQITEPYYRGERRSRRACDRLHGRRSA